MLRISEQEYRSLEVKVQNEIEKIFSEFLDRKQTAVQSKGISRGNMKKSSHQKKSPGAAPGPATSPGKGGSKAGGRPKKALNTNEFLHGARQNPVNAIEEDMGKILGRKYRRKHVR